MSVISFFSYKGGVGRTTLLANMSAYMTSLDKRVACIDLDITAPGLDIVFEIEHELPSKSIAEFLLMGKPLRAAEMCVEMRGNERWGTTGSVFVFSSPRKAKQKVVKVGNAMNKFLEVLLNVIRQQLEPDYIFLDTRSGFSREAAPAWLASNKVCLVTRCSYQHLEGTQEMLKFFQQLNTDRPEHPLKPLIVINDVPKDMPEDREREIEQWCQEFNATKLEENRELRWRDRVIIFDQSFANAESREQHIAFREGCMKAAERLL